jgi:hypothetical protein
MPRAMSLSDQRKYALELAKLGPAPDPLNWNYGEIEEFYRQWIEALRSGKYQQSRLTFLRWGTEGYSSLGVMCDIFPVGDWDVDPDAPLRDKCIQYKIHYSVNSKDIIGYMWDTLKPGPLSVTFIYDMMDMVCDRGASFEEVADSVEKQLEYRAKLKEKKAEPPKYVEVETLTKKGTKRKTKVRVLDEYGW